MKTQPHQHRTAGPLPLAILVDGLQVGGSERQAMLLARALRDCGHAALILSLRGWGPLAEAYRAEGIPVEAVTLRYPYCWWRLPVNGVRALWLMRRHRPAVLIGFDSVPNLYAAWLGRVLGLERVIWFQRNAGLDRPPGVMERWALRHVGRFAANSPAGIDFLADRVGIERSRIALIPNGVEMPRARRPAGAWRRRLGVPPDAPLACMVANLHAPKDPLTLLEAWSRLRLMVDATAAPPHLVLAGRPDALAAQVRHAIKASGLSAVVHMTGCIDDPASLLADCDLAVFSSTSEGTPNSILEAMAMGLPVVATDLPGIRAALGGCSQECLVPARDVEAWAACLGRLMKDPGLRKALGDRNRLRARECFSIKTYADSVLALCGLEGKVATA